MTRQPKVAMDPNSHEATRPTHKRCAYAHFDPVTLEPLNDATTRRALEVGFHADEFADKTVLDIGCHSGFLSFLAAKQGARAVRAFDVSSRFIDELNAAAAQNGLGVSGAVKSFEDLDPAQDAADVVLFFEVIHWLVSQGTSVPAVIAKVSDLTRETLFIEFPWDVTEPSIQAQTRLTRAEYDSSLILKELGRYFESVTVRRFMSYFGSDGRSVRALVVASGKKHAATLYALLPGLTGLELPLQWSRGNSRFLEGKPDSYFVKRPAPESSLRSLNSAWLTGLFDALHRAGSTALVLPLKLDGRYDHPAPDGDLRFVFPWLGPAPLGERPWSKMTLAELVDVALGVTRDLSRVSPELIAQLRRSRLLRALSRSELERFARACAPVLAASGLDLDPWLARAERVTDDDYASLCHGDLNTSNVLHLADGSRRVVDLDNLQLGSPYLDLCTVLAARGAGTEDVRRAFERAVTELGMAAASPTDVLFGIYVSCGWLSVMVPRTAESDAPQARRLVDNRVRGLAGLMRFGETL